MTNTQHTQRSQDNNPRNKRPQQREEGYSNRALKDGFSSLAGRIETRKAPAVLERKQQGAAQAANNGWPAVNSLKNDGEDHINIHFHARTELGKAVSLYGEYNTNHDRFGPFLTVFGLMTYLTSLNQPDFLRTSTGFDVQGRRRQNEIPRGPYITDYRWIQVDATWQKIKAFPKIAELLVKSNQPFDYYYYQKVQAPVEAGKPAQFIRIRAQEAEWFCAGLEELRAALKEGREPDLDFLHSREDMERILREKEKGAQTLGKVFNDRPVLASVCAPDNEPVTEVAKKRLPRSERIRRAKERRAQEEATQNEALETAAAAGRAFGTEKFDIPVEGGVGYRELVNPATGQPYGNLASIGLPNGGGVITAPDQVTEHVAKQTELEEQRKQDDAKRDEIAKSVAPVTETLAQESQAQPDEEIAQANTYVHRNEPNA